MFGTLNYEVPLRNKNELHKNEMMQQFAGIACVHACTVYVCMLIYIVHKNISVSCVGGFMCHSLV